jgi:hypothetical protein
MSYTDHFLAAAKSGDLSYLKYLWEIHRPPLSVLYEAAGYAAAANRIKVFWWMFTVEAGIAQDLQVAIGAAKSGNLQLLKLLRANGAVFDGQNLDFAFAAVRSNCVPAADWLINTAGVLFRPFGRFWECNITNIDMIDWIWRNKLAAYAESFCVFVVFKFSVPGLEWIEKVVECDKSFQKEIDWESVACSLLYSGKIIEIIWMEGRGKIRTDTLSPDNVIYAATYAAKRGNVHVLEWLCDHGYSDHVMRLRLERQAAQFGQLDVLKWLHQRTPFQSSGSLRGWPTMNGHLHVLRWLDKTFNECKPWIMTSVKRIARMRLRRQSMVYEYVYDTTPESVFVAAGAHSVWLAIRRRRNLQTLIALLLCVRRRKDRHLPPELWEQVIGPTL